MKYVNNNSKMEAYMKYVNNNSKMVLVLCLFTVLFSADAFGGSAEDFMSELTQGSQAFARAKRAMEEGQLEVAKALFAQRPFIGEQLLVDAVVARNVGMVTTLLSLGVDADAYDTDEHGRTAVVAAAQNGDRRLVRLLLEKGARLPDLTDLGSSYFGLALGLNERAIKEGCPVLALIEQERKAIVEKLLREQEVEGSLHIPQGVARAIAELEGSELEQ